jgi:hypothetical protein
MSKYKWQETPSIRTVFLLTGSKIGLFMERGLVGESGNWKEEFENLKI